jgi:hypothetical protein
MPVIGHSSFSAAGLCRRVRCRQPGQGSHQRAALLRGDSLQQVFLHGPDVGLRGGVAGSTCRGDPDEVGAPVGRVGLPLDQPPA